MAFDHRKYNQEFRQRVEAGHDPENDAETYGVRIAPAQVEEGASYWRIIGVHHLTPEENRGKHAAYVEVLDENGRRVQDPNLRIGWSWEGRRADEQAPSQPLDKPANEPAGNVPIQGNMHLEMWIEGDGPSDKAVNMHARHPDELGPNGETWNSFGHHSFYVVFQRTRQAAAPEGNGHAPAETTPPEEEPETTPATARAISKFFPEFIYGLHESGGEDLMLAAGRPGWVLELAEVGLDGTQGRADYTGLAEKGLGVIVRLDHGYGSTGTLPTPDKYPQFAAACARFVARSQGCHIWIIGNEPNHEQERPNGQPITPDQYVQAYKLCREKIRSLDGHGNDLVLVAGPAPWNNLTQYPGNEKGDWVTYFTDTLDRLGAEECDGFSLHTYTRAHDPGRISVDIPFDAPGFRHRRDEFRTYRDFVERIPDRFRRLPVLITETDPTDRNIGWRPGENRGWIQTAYREIADWNSDPNHQPIQALILYRWRTDDPDQEQWVISTRPGIIEDFRQALRLEPADSFRVRPPDGESVVKPPAAPIPLIFTNQQAINAFYYAAQRLGRGDWELLEKAGLDLFEMARARERSYSGPPLQDLPNLSPLERAIVSAELLAELLKQVRWVGLVNATLGLYMRTGPGRGHAVIKALPHETTVQVLGTVGDWLYVVAEGDAGFVHSDYVIPRVAPLPVEPPIALPPVDEELAPPAARRITLPPEADWLDKQIAYIWNSYGGLLSREAERLDIDPAIAVAVFAAESGGDAFGPDGRMTVRFEVHVFWNLWGRLNPSRFRQHFRFDNATPTAGHQWRPDVEGEWQILHRPGDQATEWAALEFARQWAPEAALQSLSMGAPQIMGFNFARIGYASVQEMFDAFQGSVASQIRGFFRFVETQDLVPAIRQEDFLAFAGVYNGPLFAANYARIIRERLERFRTLTAPTRAATAGQRGIAPPADVHERLPLPVSPEAAVLAQADPDLYRAWSEHIRQGFENNNEMFHRVLKGFMDPYRLTMRMYQVLFGVGILLFVVAAALGYLTGDANLSLIFGGLGIVTFLGYFVSRPLQALEENLQFITWLGIVYNTYWTRLAYTLDQATAHQQLEDATNDAIREIQRLIDKHAAMRGKRPGLR